MSKAKISVTTAVVTDVRLKPNTRQMVKARVEEHATLASKKKEIDRRQKAIRKEVDALFSKDGQGKALIDGTTLDGFKLVMVQGTRKVFDQEGFLKKHGLTVEDIAEFTTDEPNEPYVKITAPGEKD